MRLSFLPVLAVICSWTTFTLSSVVPATHQLRSLASSSGTNQSETGSCTNETTYLRKEWRTLSLTERKSYVDAVLCLQKLPSLYPEVEGAKSRFDDFQLEHINQTFTVHFDALFLPWHRWFLWTYDQALRQECGYRSFQPYWDWTIDGHDVDASPLFDGSPYSLSGNGDFIPNRSDITNIISIPTIPLVNVTRPPGTGGGCVTTGPFANIQVPFGPFGEILNTSLINSPKLLAYTPHCLRRDLNSKITGLSFTNDTVANLMNSPNISTFNNIVEIGNNNSYFNLHAAGHFGVGGDMRDTFSSPGDPIFYLHHAQIDRLWTLWQAQDPAQRQYAIDGTQTAFDYPASPVEQLNDTMHLGKLSPGGPRPIRDFLNTSGGPFCYKYV